MLPSPDAGRRTVPSERYVGRYETRPRVVEVTLDEEDRLWLTASERNEALTMTEAAGIPVETDRYELRQVEGDTFVLIDSSGAPVQAVEFLGAADRAAFLHLSGRAAPRTG
jgi:hypothetical protein